MEIITPGRICLFGEHQDYLGLPVIALAISLHSKIKFTRRKDDKVVIRLPDINHQEVFSLKNLKYTKERDYFSSGLKVCIDNGLTFSRGFECTITSTIPIGAGTSSSSSIVVGFINLLSYTVFQFCRLVYHLFFQFLILFLFFLTLRKQISKVIVAQFQEI